MRYKVDKNGEILNAQWVIYKGKKYITGNRYHGLVDLHDESGRFSICVRMLKNHTFRK